MIWLCQQIKNTQLDKQLTQRDFYLRASNLSERSIVAAVQKKKKLKNEYAR